MTPGSVPSTKRHSTPGSAALRVCPRCQRIATGWPLARADVCSPKDWAYCIRNLTDGS